MTPVRIAHEAGINISPEYATCCPFSKDNKHLLLTQSGGWFRLHDGEGKYIRTLPSDVNTSSRPRWSRFNPDSLTYIGGNSLYAFDVKTGAASIIHTFGEYIRTTTDDRNGVDDSGEADISADGNHRVLSGIRPDGSVEVFVYNIAAGTKGISWKYGAFDGLKISSDNRVILSEPAGMFAGANKPLLKIAPFNSHSCPCVYRGRPSLAWLDGEKHMQIIDLDTAKHTQVPFVVDSSLVVAHVSACDKPLLIVSTSGKNAPSQIVRISLEDLSAEVLCETGTVYRGYESQPKASLSRDGSRVVYSVDDGQQISTWMLKLAAEKPVQANPNVPLRFLWKDHRATIDKDGITILAA